MKDKTNINVKWTVTFGQMSFQEGEPHDILHSSVVSSVTYDPVEQTLDVVFWDSKPRVYRYSGVHRVTAESFVTSHSAGSYFAQHIRDNHVTEVFNVETSQTA